MTIEKYTFTPPVQVGTPDGLNMAQILLFATDKEEVPPDHRQELTPPGYRDRYILYTRSVTDKKGREDTVGEVEVIRRGG